VIDMRDDRDIAEFHKILTKPVNGTAGRARACGPRATARP